MKIRAPMQLGMDGPTLAEVDRSTALANARNYVPDIEGGARALRKLADIRTRNFEPIGAGVLNRMAERLEHFATVLDKGGKF